MHEGLAANKIPVSALTAARLSVKLTFSEVPWSAPKREIFISQGKAVRTEKMNRGLMECDSNVATDEAVCVNRRSRNLYSVWMTADWGARVVSPSCFRYVLLPSQQPPPNGRLTPLSAGCHQRLIRLISWYGR